MIKKTLLITVICFALVSTSIAVPQSFSEIVKAVNPAVVYIEITREMQAGPSFWGQMPKQDVTGSGSGVIIDAKNGYVLTAAHVISEIDKAAVYLPDGRKFDAVEFLYDTQTDVGVVKIDVPEGEILPEVKFGSSEELEVGDWVLAMGSPLGKALANSVSAGIVSGKSRKSGILGQLGIEDFIQTDAVINKGNSGGPLVNMAGEIVGINSNIISATGLSTGLGFAVPSDLAKDVVEKLITEGVVVRGYLGVSVASLDALKEEQLEDISEELQRRGGAYVVQVVEDGPSDEAGIESGDVITKVDEQQVTSSSELIRYISSKSPDETVVCYIERDGKSRKIKVKLGIRPGTEGKGATAVITSRDKQSEAYKKLGIVADDYAEPISEMPGSPVLAGAKIRYVASGSMADEFGLEDGDIIVEVNGEKVSDAAELNEEIGDGSVSKGILLTVTDQEGKSKKVFIKKF